MGIETEKELREALAERERELSAIYANVPGILFCVTVDPDGEFRFVSMSDGGLVATGLTREQFVGARVRDVIPPPSREMVLDNYREAIRTHRTIRWEEVSVYPAGQRHGEVAVTPLYDENGVATRLIGIVHDVTERKAVEAAINEANTRKTDFIAALSHELRNPLAAITASLAVLDMTAGDGVDAVRAREVVGRQVTHMSRLVDDLLDVTRITHGRIELHRASVELRALLSRTVDDHRVAFDAHGVTCDVALPDTDLWLDADETRLVQALGNLLTNAIKFTPVGGRVTVSATRESELAVVRVRDSGIGIDPENLGLLFQPFTQARQPLDQSARGLGLGLALVKGIVTLHGGTVTAASEGANKGTEITVRIPITGTAPSSAVAPVSSSVPCRRVLVIEDNADASEALRLVLRLRGHEVRVCADGPSGVALARTFAPHVVLCDLGLPGMSGYEVARLLHLEGGRLPILVALSGYAQPRDRERSSAAGFAHHLPKPVTLAELDRLIATAADASS